jgi:CHASE2 domain-containing sensor protein
MGGGARVQAVASNHVAMRRRLHLTAFRVSLLVTLGIIGFYQVTGQATLIRNLETKLLDLRLLLRGAQHPHVPVALVLIDDKSIAELGPSRGAAAVWPPSYNGSG